MDKIARIDMGAAGGPKVTVGDLGEYAGLGGRAMTSLVVAAEVHPLAHPLGAENKLVISPGMLSGTTGSMTGRLSVGCKSPLTGTIKESNAGGQAAQVLARLGYAAVILEGKPEGDDLYKILINKDGIQVIVDNSLKLMDNYPVIEKLRQEYGDKVAYMSIGSAGERKLLAASIACTDPELRPTRHCGRGGVGAVMGAKRVKAIIIDDAGMKMRPPKDPDKYRDANRKFVEGLRKHPVTGEGLPAYGTNILTNVLNEAGGYPTYNFKDGQFPGSAKLSGETQAQLEIDRGGTATHGCHRGCVIQCSGIYNDKDGHYLTKQPEYETVWSHGGHCGIDDLDTVAMLDFMDDNIGVDTIEMGVTIGVAMDAGIIEFGDKEGAIRLMEEVQKGTPLGRVLGSGAAITGKVFGVETGTGGQGPGAAGLRSARHSGYRRHLCDHHPGGRPHRRLRHRHQHPQGRRRRGPAQDRRADRVVAQPADSHGSHRLHRYVPVHRLCHHGSTGNLPGAARHARVLPRHQHDR